MKIITSKQQKKQKKQGDDISKLPAGSIHENNAQEIRRHHRRAVIMGHIYSVPMEGLLILGYTRKEIRRALNQARTVLL